MQHQWNVETNQGRSMSLYIIVGVWIGLFVCKYAESQRGQTVCRYLPDTRTDKLSHPKTDKTADETYSLLFIFWQPALKGTLPLLRRFCSNLSKCALTKQQSFVLMYCINEQNSLSCHSLQSSLRCRDPLKAMKHYVVEIEALELGDENVCWGRTSLSLKLSLRFFLCWALRSVIN